MSSLWNRDQEREFFVRALELAGPEQLFYVAKDRRFLAYWPKSYDGDKTTLQSRNSLIGAYTERWTADLFSEIAHTAGAYSVQRVISREIGLTAQSPADVAICRTREAVQEPKNILMIVEVKMSVVWNWEFAEATGELACIGDYTTHQGNPGLLRSDTMLKAIGKSISIRVSSFTASRIPIIVVGNTPVTKSYYEKVDHLRTNGIIQGFWSVNPKPLDTDRVTIESTPRKGFQRFDAYDELKTNALELLNEEREFFSGMQTRNRLGRIIQISDKETTYEAKAQRFVELLRQPDNGL